VGTTAEEQEEETIAGKYSPTVATDWRMKPGEKNSFSGA